MASLQSQTKKRRSNNTNHPTSTWTFQSSSRLGLLWLCGVGCLYWNQNRTTVRGPGMFQPPSIPPNLMERLRKASKHFGTLHHFWRHTGLPLHWKLRIYNAAFVPMTVYGMESAALTSQDLHRIEPFRAQSLRKMHRIPSTDYTKVLAPDIPTISNQQLREQTSQPPLTHHIQRARLKLFGQVLRAPEQCLERNCCFTRAFVDRCGVAGEGFRRGRPRIHWAEQCTAQACISRPCRWQQERCG